MTADDIDDRALKSAREIDPPPPAPALLEKLGAMKPVGARSRFGAFGLVAGLGLVWPAATLLRLPLRPDLAALPRAQVVVGAALWAAGAFLALGAALVPRRGDVLPSADRAGRIGAGAMLALLAFAALATASVPGVSLRPEDAHLSALAAGFECGRYVFLVAAVLLVLGFFALRRVLPVGGRRIGIALGAAGGALGGLALHFVCPIAVTTHVVFGHVGGMVLASIVGGLLFSALLDR